MSVNNPFELFDNLINGRPERPSLIRIKLTKTQIAKLLEGKELTFKAGDQTVEIRKSGTA